MRIRPRGEIMFQNDENRHSCTENVCPKYLHKITFPAKRQRRLGFVSGLVYLVEMVHKYFVLEGLFFT